MPGAKQAPAELTPANPAVRSVSAFFPCYNDAPTIAGLVAAVAESLESLGVGFDVTVVDDGSGDDSLDVLARAAAETPALSVVEHGRNRGYGAALRSGFAAATKDWVFYTDGDGQYDPREVEALVAAASDSVDVVQGYKLARGDGLVRALVGRAYHHVVRVAFGLRVRDTDCDFRLVRRSLVERVELRHDSGMICVEMMRRFQDAGARFAEVPVHHYDRAHGRSQFMRVGRVARTLLDLGRLWAELVLLRPGWPSWSSRRRTGLLP